MDIKEVLEFANNNKACWLATSEDDQPHVRGMMMWFADETGFYYHTGTNKSLYDQLQSNPKVEIAYFNNAQNQQDSRMMRLTGRVEMVQDQVLEEKLFQDRPWLHAVKQANPDTQVVIFRVFSGEIQFWNMMV
ncbi:MAG: pyridoxamine 5'-phosphate oxidase family protein, partial [Candidatus Margulisbacteria bacterium]|nr:pyridoxamine 5'-phosphate oxidase family protein [Candidatus Margulisiibacteriota bacterium]